ncbi:unnamed protein product [Rhodiola kirilowii]
MDKSWMHLWNKCDPQFSEGFMAFIEFVKQKKPWTTYTHPCPCRRFRLHHEKLSLNEIQVHLFRNGMMRPRIRNARGFIIIIHTTPTISLKE